MRRTPLLSGLRRSTAGLLGLLLTACSAPPPPPPPVPPEELAAAEARSKATQAADLLKRKDLDGALTLALESLELRRKALGESSPETESALELLGDIYFARGQLDVADQVLTRSLAIRTILVGPDDVALAEVLDRLFVVVERRGQIDRAAELGARSVALRKAAGGPPSYELALALLNLGSIHLQRCELDAAAPLLTQALAAAEATLPVGSPLFARFLDALGDLNRYRGLTTDALPLFQREERLLVVRDLREAERMLALLRRQLSLHEDRGDLEQRSSVIARSLVLVDRWFPARDPAFLELALPLASLYNAAANRPKAVLLYQRLHLVEHVFPLAPQATSTRLDPPLFALGFEPATHAASKRNACVPRGKEATTGPVGRLEEQREKLRACYGELPASAPRAAIDARLVIELGPEGEVKKIGALTFDDVPDALMGCVLPRVTAIRFAPAAEGAGRLVLPLHLAPLP